MPDRTPQSNFFQTAVRKIVPALAIASSFIVLPAAMLLNQSGAPAKRTGAPGDGDGTPGNSGSCADVGCHNTYPVNSGVGGVIIDAPAQFNPGVPVEFVVTVHDTTRFRFGFQTTIKNASAENVGTFELIDSNTRFATGNSDYVTHTLANDNAQWTVKWNPPAQIAEDVTIYVGGNAADGRFTAASDYTYEAQAILGYAPIAGIDETPETGAINLDFYPNPVGDILNISYELFRESPVTLEIFDVVGREVMAESFGSRSLGVHQNALDVSQLKPGVYFSRLTTRDDSIARTVIVSR